ncbi:MAG: BatD family protein [Flavobacteriales bacterium]
MDRTEIGAGEPVKLTVTLTNAPMGSGFTPPALGGLVVVQGPFDNSSFQMINGRTSGSVSRTWYLTATQPGDYTIGAATARIGQGTIQTTPIKVHVTKGANSATNNPALQQGQKNDPNLFCTITLSKNKAYVGEQIIATYTLYSRYTRLQAGDYDLPKVNGFWTEEIDIGQPGFNGPQQVVNGLSYNVATLKKQVLFPQRAGKLRLEPMTLNYRVNASFFSAGTPVTIHSNAAEVTVLELPSGKPAYYIGAVGDLKLEMTTGGTAVKANEAIDIKVSFTGRANLKLIDAPKLAFPPDFEVYDPKITDRITVNGSGMSGTREFQYLVIPRHEGDYDIGRATFSYFDPASGQYRQLSSEPLTFHIAKGDANAAQISRPSRSDVQQLGQDIRYIRTGDLKLKPIASHLFGSWPYIAGLLAPVLAFTGLVFWHRRRQRDLADTQGMRRKGADRVARQRLKAAEQALKANDREAFYQAMGKAMEGYIADKFNLGVAQVTVDAVREKLAHLEDGKLANDYASLMSDLEMARFAPFENKPRQQSYDKAAALDRPHRRPTARMKRLPPRIPGRLAKALLSLPFALAVLTAKADGPDDLARSAQDLYAKGAYREALALYDSVNTTHTSAPLLYNIGNCYSKLDDNAHAILYFERALRLAPGAEDIQANLDLARAKVVDRVDQLPGFTLGSVWDRVRGGKDVDQWARRSLWAVLITFVMASLGLLAKGRVVKRGAYLVSAIGVLITATCISLAAYRVGEVADRTEAIIVAPKVDVLGEPRTGATTLFVLHEGTKVSVLQEQDGWFEVKLSSGSVGWAAPATLERI